MALVSNPGDTIVALATPSGVGALGVLRISGTKAIELVDSVFSKDLSEAEGYTLHFGKIRDGDIILDEVLLSLFRAPRSYTGEDLVEISCHGSPYILRKVMELLIRKGARTADQGEFTMRAFMNRKMDLSQAEAVADLIASDSQAAHQMAMDQMRGGISERIGILREKLINFASLIELELDFGEEDVEFADRDDLKKLVYEIQSTVHELQESFTMGNALKEGIATAIVGKPNAGKSTLLNALLQEERAIVSDIAGTTRDTIEEQLHIGGVLFRFIDTAGIRETTDEIERVGVERARASIARADLVIFLIDATTETPESIKELIKDIPAEKLILCANKSDLTEDKGKFSALNALPIASKQHDIQALLDTLKHRAEEMNKGDRTMINNARHYEALSQTADALDRVLTGLNENRSGDLLAFDIRQALHFLGLITGEITTDDLLGNIFGKFCIGK